jgi:hypothetical protein
VSPAAALQSVGDYRGHNIAEALYQNWLESSGHRFRTGFRELFMQQEAALREAMQEEHDDHPGAARHDRDPAPR